MGALTLRPNKRVKFAPYSLWDRQKAAAPYPCYAFKMIDRCIKLRYSMTRIQ